MKAIQVTKRDGKKENLDLDKIHKVVFWACDGLTGVSESEIELRSQLQIVQGTKTSDIHETLIKSASELISEENPNYQYVASRLVNYQLRKEVFGRYEPGTIRHLVEQNVAAGVYTQEILDNYDEADFRKMEKIIKHDRDNLIAYAGIEQWRGKYLVKNRVTNQFYETPQIAFILIAAVGFMAYPKETRMTYVKDFYDAISTFDLSLPTPIMAGLRTPEKQFSSCVTVACDDNLKSIIATSGVVMEYISSKAGIGLDLGRIRAIDSEVAGGRKSHTGQIPIVRLMQSATKSMAQGGIRGGSTTVHYPIWHYEFEDLIVLKNNKGTEFNRVRQLDYSFLFNRTMYERLVNGGNITFFSPKDVDGLLEAFWVSPDRFEELYVKYENDPSIRRKTLPAIDVFKMFMTERKETGRIYLMNIDHANSHGSFIPELAPITQSNLCVDGDTIIKVLFQGEELSVKISDIGDMRAIDPDIKVMSSKDGVAEYKAITNFALMSDSADTLEIIDNDTGKRIVCTPDHLVFTKNRGYVRAIDLNENDSLEIYDTTNNGNIRINTSKKTKVYDITVADNENFFANDILVHNCQEITLPTGPLQHMEDEEGRISLCTLAALNWGKIKSPEDFEIPAKLAVRFLDELLTYQDFPIKAAKNSNNEFRPLGVGIVNLAYFLAKNNLKYDKDALQLVDEYAEAYSYYLIKASVDLAEEKGACESAHKTRYGSGIMPIDTRSPNVDELVPHVERQDWEGLRAKAKRVGIRNATLMAAMPAECQHWENKIALADGRELNFHELLEDNGVSWADIESSGIPQRYAFKNPVPVKTRSGTDIATEYYYNGVAETFELEFDDGNTYKFTKNHKLLVVRNGEETWVEIGNLKIGDDIVSVDNNYIGIKSLISAGFAHTWDISTIKEEYILPNGIVSHNTSAQISNSTNGIEPVRALVSEKVSKHGVLKQVVPEIGKLKNKYDLLWDQPSPKGYLMIAAVLQKYIDQSISVNTSYNPHNYPDGKISMFDMLEDILSCYKWGLKNLYYFNTYDGIEQSEPVEKGSLETIEDDVCDSCVL